MSSLALLAGFASTAVNAGVQSYVNDVNWQRQKELNNLNYQRYLEQRNYDNPINQMQRLRAAGINPALYFSGNGMSSSSPAPMASVYNDVAPNMSGLPSTADLLAVERQKAEIENINADTQNKKEETKGKEIQNAVDKMTKDAFYSAYEEGLVHAAVRAGFLKEKYEGEMSRYSMSQAAWNTAIMLGTSLSELLESGDLGDSYERIVDENGTQIGVLPPFSYSEKTFEHSKVLFVGGQEAQITANAAAKLMSELYQEKQKKDIDIYKKLNEMASSGTWYEKAIANVALVSLFISQERFSLPSIGINIHNGRNKE